MYSTINISSDCGHIAPIKFTPLYKRKIWGGEKFYLSRDCPQPKTILAKAGKFRG